MGSLFHHSSHKPLRILVVGIGKQAVNDHLPAIVSSDKYQLVGLVDSRGAAYDALEGVYDVPFFESVEAAMGEIKDIDVALLCVPHNAYRDIIAQLAPRGIHIIKEKPFAVTMDEALFYAQLIDEYKIQIHVTMQRRFNPIYSSFPQLLRRIGRLYAIDGMYTFNINKLDEGWRSSRSEAGGGALIDMGYHIIDLIVWYFGVPNLVNCSMSSGNRADQAYDVEDTAYVGFTYNDKDEHKVLGNVIISRVFPTKTEYLHAYGTNGSVRVERGRLVRFDNDGNEVEALERVGAWPSAFVDQLEAFAEEIGYFKHAGIHIGDTEDTLHAHMKHTAVIDACYRSAHRGTTEDPLGHFRKITQESNNQEKYRVVTSH